MWLLPAFVTNHIVCLAHCQLYLWLSALPIYKCKFSVLQRVMLDAPPVQENQLLYKETLPLQENVHWGKQSVSRKSYTEQLNLHTGAGHTLMELLPLCLWAQSTASMSPLQYCQLPWVERMPFWLPFSSGQTKWCFVLNLKIISDFK